MGEQHSATDDGGHAGDHADAGAMDDAAGEAAAGASFTVEVIGGELGGRTDAVMALSRLFMLCDLRMVCASPLHACAASAAAASAACPSCSPAESTASADRPSWGFSSRVGSGLDGGNGAERWAAGVANTSRLMSLTADAKEEEWRGVPDVREYPPVATTPGVWKVVGDRGAE